MNDVLRVLDRAAEQGGLITTAQAARIGVSRLRMSRLEQSGTFERVAQGVYRAAGSAPHEHQDVLAAWMALEKGVFLAERAAAPSEGLVVGGAAAAALHGIGDLFVDTVDLLSPRERRTTREGVRVRVRDVGGQDVVLAHGLPALSVTATIADLAQQRVPFDHVADALRDGSEHVDLPRLDALLDPLAARNGFDDGAAFRIRLYELAGLDPESLAADAAKSPLAPLIVMDFLKDIDFASLEALRPLGSLNTSPLFAHLQTLVTPIAASWGGGTNAHQLLQSISAGVLAPMAEAVRSLQAGPIVEQMTRTNAEALKQIGAVGQSAIGAQLAAAPDAEKEPSHDGDAA